MRKPRINLTEKERIVINALGTDSDGASINMGERSVDDLIQKEKSNKFNDEIEKYNVQLETNHKKFEESQNNVTYDINRAEIKPMFARILVKPFKVNPFQKMEVKGNIIVDAGGYTPHAEINPTTGKYEEQKQFIMIGCVIDIGPETKYLQEGDVVYYRIDTAVPVPFFKQGLISVNETQVIAVVAENLSSRFSDIKNA